MLSLLVRIAWQRAATVIVPPACGSVRGELNSNGFEEIRDYETALKAYAMDAADRKGAGLTDLAMRNLVEYATTDNVVSLIP